AVEAAERRDAALHTATGRPPAAVLGGLPQVGDADVDAYAARLGTAGWLLRVPHPLRADFALWARVRDALANLWWRVGWPTGPVTAELTLGRGHTRDRDPWHPETPAGLLWVLHGGVTLRLRGGRPPTLELTGRAGDLLA